MFKNLRSKIVLEVVWFRKEEGKIDLLEEIDDGVKKEVSSVEKRKNNYTYDQIKKAKL